MYTHQNTIDSSKESKRGKFCRLADRRLAEALDNIRLLENLLQNPYAYEYSNADIAIIQSKLLTATQRLGLYKKADDYAPLTDALREENRAFDTHKH